MNQQRFDEIKLMVEKEHFFMRPQDANAIQELIAALEPTMRIRKLVSDNSNKLKLADLFKEMNVFPTNGEMRRLIYQGGVKLNDEVFKLSTYALNNIDDVTINDGVHTIQIGKRILYYFQVEGGKLRNWSKQDLSKE